MDLLNGIDFGDFGEESVRRVASLIGNYFGWLRREIKNEKYNELEL